MRRALAFHVPLILLLPLGSASDPTLSVWVDPATLPFVPTPKLVHAYAPVSPGESCAGASVLSPGPAPYYVSGVRLLVEVDACAPVWAEVEWTINGTTYRGTVDVAAGAVYAIQKISEDPTATAGANVEPPFLTQRSDWWPSTDAKAGETMTPGRGWFHREGHGWLHFWSRSGAGNENVKLNYNWGYSGEFTRRTELRLERCDADGRWVNDACHSESYESINRGPPGSGAHAYGAFHSSWWPTNLHEWHVDVYPTPDQGVDGYCTSRGELPWSYATSCDIGPGNV